MKKDLVTIILLHYNQMEYIFEALDSILTQDYSQIELIITDDCSSDFNEKEIRDYIEKHKKNNIKNYIINVNEKNIGTVKTLNKCIQMASGKYLSFFAADDRLNNEFVVSKYVEAFKEKDADVYAFQCLMCDNNLKNVYFKFVDKNTKKIFNKPNNKKVFERMVLGCAFASGATVFKTNLLKEHPFDEKYKVVEDWAYYIKLAKLNKKILYYDYLALDHRDGGVSHSEDSPGVKAYRKDIMRIYECEILPDLKKLGFKARYKVIDNYERMAYMYKKKIANYGVQYKIMYKLISSYKNILALIYKEKFVYSFIYTTLFTFALDKIFDFAIASKLWFYLLCLPTILLMLINIALSGIRCFKYILKKLVSIIKK